MKKSIDEEINEISENMEKSTMNPIEEIKKAIMEMGPEGLKKSLPELDDDNQELLMEILEEMQMEKSHRLPLEAPKNKKAEGMPIDNDAADEKIATAANAEGDNEQKHQGGAHDMSPEGWEGQVIKGLGLDEIEDEEEVLDALGDVFKAYKGMMKKKMMKKEMKKECDMDMGAGMEKADEGDDDIVAMEKAKKMMKNMMKKEMMKKDNGGEEAPMMEKPKKDPALPGLGGDMMDEPSKPDMEEKPMMMEKKMAKKMKKAHEALILEKAKKKAKEKLEKVTASRNLWGKPGAKRGVGIY